MILTDEKIQEFKGEIERLFNESYSKPDVTIVLSSSEPKIRIKVEQMYSFVSCNFSHLKRLSELFGTEKIDVDDWSMGGCDTCDYGSSYVRTFQIYEPWSKEHPVEKF